MLKLILGAIRRLLGLKKKVVKTVERAVEIKERIYDTIEVVEEYKEQPVKAVKKLFPSLERHIYLAVIVVLTLMYIMGLLAVISGIAAWPIIGILVSVIVLLINKSRNENGEEQECT